MILVEQLTIVYNYSAFTSASEVSLGFFLYSFPLSDFQFFSFIVEKAGAVDQSLFLQEPSQSQHDLQTWSLNSSEGLC